MISNHGQDPARSSQGMAYVPERGSSRVASARSSIVRPQPAMWDTMVVMASWADMRERQRVRVALFKGKPVPSEDYDTVRQVLDQVRWYPPIALAFAIVCCFWLRLLLFGHIASHWTALLGVLGTGIWTWSLLWQHRRIVAGATKMRDRRDG